MITVSENSCRNCNQNIVQNFCSNCGQKRYKRIDRSYIWEEIQYTTIHTNKGFLYSIKNILKNPGKAARGFVDGNRINYYKPIGLAFILSGISAFISFKIIGFGAVLKANAISQNPNISFIDDLTLFQANYSAFIMLSFIPILALCSKIVFRKWGHNYYEHVVMNAFGLSFYTIITICLISPILYGIKDDISLMNKVSMYSMLIMPLMMIWFYKNYYSEKSLKSIIPRLILKSGIFVTFFFVVIIIATISYIIILGPEALKQFQPK